MRSNTPISLTSSLIGAFALAGSLGLAGCSKGSDKKPAPSTSAQPGEEAQSEAELDAVLATIDGIEITVRVSAGPITSGQEGVDAGTLVLVRARHGRARVETR